MLGNFLMICLMHDSKLLSDKNAGLDLASPHAWKRITHCMINLKSKILIFLQMCSQLNTFSFSPFQSLPTLPFLSLSLSAPLLMCHYIQVVVWCNKGIILILSQLCIYCSLTWPWNYERFLLALYPCLGSSKYISTTFDVLSTDFFFQIHIVSFRISCIPDHNFIAV